MEAILTDAKRGVRSILKMLHADSGAEIPHGVAKSRSKGGLSGFSDIYGRQGRLDPHSSRELLGFYALMARSERSPFTL